MENIKNTSLLLLNSLDINGDPYRQQMGFSAAAFAVGAWMRDYISQIDVNIFTHLCRNFLTVLAPI